ncbi:ferritin-like domain-containing protein [Parachitinimonas caeni]|uniref:Ferritin-like domain-containing protein n=1 Tax=Parachitinimonas caeni TaxID=3031301 RepID=A0ABT7DZ74_9NEIS|nr:ferritin-like domain-containing protein [Parachitinimonas caeni]MDK2124373.1 ferritin-like domain-containing protein [Parachitinimonas caeni]
MPLNAQASISKAKKFVQDYSKASITLASDLESELAALRTLLHNAMLLEHATIPPYLTMLYSIDDDVQWRILEVVRSVVVEEMLHLTLSGNVLNAIGGKPNIDSPDFMPNYPSALPYGLDGIKVSLLAFSKAAVKQGLDIEQPRDVDVKTAHAGDVSSMNISEFYHYIQARLCAAVARFGESAIFCGNPAHQIPPKAFYYDGSGGVIEVRNLLSAIRALQMICDQGEGANDTIWTGKDSAREAGFRMVAHYFRFNELHEERLYKEGDTQQSGPTGERLEVPWHRAVNTLPNAKLADYPPGEVHDAVAAFNVQYCRILAMLQAAFTGRPELLIKSVVAMCDLRDSVRRLMANPFPGKPGLFSSPTFEYVATSPSLAIRGGGCPFSGASAAGSNQQTIDTLNQAFATGDLQLALSCLSEDVVWDISGPPSVPYAGVFYGHDGYSRFWSLLNDTVRFVSAGSVKTFFSDNEAMAYGGEQGFVQSNNVPYHYDWAILYRFNSAHKITLIRQYFNPSRIDAAIHGQSKA